MDGIDTATRAPGGEVEEVSSLLNELSGMFEDVPPKPPEQMPEEPVAEESPEEIPVAPAPASMLARSPIPNDPIIWKPARRSFLRLRR